MTDLLATITLLTGIGIGWLMGRTLRDRIMTPGWPRNVAGKPRNGPRSDEHPQGDHPADCRHERAAEDTMLCDRDRRWRCPDCDHEWTEARP